MTASRSPRQQTKGRHFKPLLERLEDRLTPVGQPFVEAPVIHSVNDVLSTTLIAHAGPAVGDVTDYTGLVANGGTAFNNSTASQVQGAPMRLLQRPTLVVNPGDTIELTLINGIQDVPGYTTFGPTNLHAHGLHVSPL